MGGEGQWIEGLIYWETVKLTCVLHRVMKSPHCPILQREMKSSAVLCACVRMHVGVRQSDCVWVCITHVPMNGNVLCMSVHVCVFVRIAVSAVNYSTVEILQ